MQRTIQLLTRFRKDERGVFMVLFAVMAIVLIATSGAVVDFSRVQQARTKAQTALDAASLALQAQLGKQTAAQIQATAQAILTERIADSTVTAIVDSAVPDINSGKLTLTAHVVVPTYFVQFVGVTSISSNLLSEVTRGSVNLEVAVALDVTISMNTPSSKLTALKDATKDLIGAVVRDSQPPTVSTYTKMALVPYSMAVNVGSSNANAIRGTPDTNYKTISATWAADTAKTITGISAANNAVITTSGNHNLTTGDTIWLSGISTTVSNADSRKTKMSTLNDRAYTITKLTNTTFSIGANTNGYAAFNSGGTPRATECARSDCQVTVTSTVAHGFANNDPVYISNMSNLSGLNNRGWLVTNRTNTSFVPQGSTPNIVGTTTSGGANGRLYCASYGCQYYYFQNAAGGRTLNKVNNCVTERPAHSYDDTAPTTTRLNMHYTNNGGDCLDQSSGSLVVQPLTSNKSTLLSVANALKTSGSTSGHIGLAWAWYMLSPNFKYLWPTSSQPAEYRTPKVVKAIVLMTDGMFNTPYCDGVVANDADPIAGNNNSRISCNAIASSADQAKELCNSIKRDTDIYIYTVGFDIGGRSADEVAARQLLNDCATEEAYFYLADDADDLRDAFKAIGQSLSELRVSR